MHSQRATRLEEWSTPNLWQVMQRIPSLLLHHNASRWPILKGDTQNNLTTTIGEFLQQRLCARFKVEINSLLDRSATGTIQFSDQTEVCRLND